MKNKIWLFILFLIGLASPALADVGDGMMNNFGMMGPGMMNGFGMGLLGLVYLAIGSFIFALIFWYTYLWIIPKKRR